MNEKPLHASLKEWYARPEDQVEVEVDGFVIDLVRGDLLLEIQTGHFASIKQKLTTLVSAHRVRLLYPIAQEKRIVRLSKDGGRAGAGRKSPRRGRVEDLFWEMVSIPQLLTHPNFSLEVLMIKVEEVRRHVGARHWRRRGWIVEERRLLEVVERRLYQELADWKEFVPEDLGPFTAKRLAQAIGIRELLAQKMVYCLRKATVVRLIGKEGRANLYAVRRRPANPGVA